MKAALFPLASLLLVLSPLPAGQPLKVELTDGSVLLGESSLRSLPLQSSVLDLDLRLADLQTIERSGKTDAFRLTTTADDLLHGEPGLPELPLEGLFGNVKIPLSALSRIEVLPANKRTTDSAEESAGVRGEFQRDFAGLRWDLWRTAWEISDGRLASLPKPRPGFRYGHGGHGRGGLALTGIGDRSWRDYEVEFDFQMLPATRAFYPHHIPGETRGMGVILRAQEVSESWNEPSTQYMLSLNPNGTWGIYKQVGYHCKSSVGWTSAMAGTSLALATGKGTGPLSPDGNRIRVRVEGDRIGAWVNGEPLGEAIDEDAAETGDPIPYGGWGVQWRYESMGWIGNVKTRKLGGRKAR